MQLDFPSIITIFISGICTGGVFGFFASSFTFQLGALQIVDFSFGSWLMLGMYLTFFMYKIWSIGIVPLVIILLLLYFCAGFLMRRFILYKGDVYVQILATMGISIFVQSAVLLVFTAYPRSLGIVEKTIMVAEGIYVGLTKLIVSIIAAAILLGFQIFLNRTWTGKAIRAVVQQKETAYLMGVDANRIINIAFAMSYVMISISAIMLLIIFPVTPDAGGSYQMTSFLICVLAGLGNMNGSFFAGIIIGVFTGFVNYYISSMNNVVLFIVFVIVLILKPQGLFKARLTR